MYQSRIAIVGSSCRFPGANGPDEFWQLLQDGVDAVREVPSDRWDTQSVAALASDPRAGASRWAGLLDGIDQFDAKFFGISAREARAMDPQQRLLLEVTWEALEDAGLRREDIAGSATDVFIGIAANDYSHIQGGKPETLEVYDATGNALSIAANRISYLFDLRGASMAVDTACSSSLTAVHLASRRLRDGEANVAIAGGVSLILSPAPSLVFAQSGMLAADGHCKTFDAAADGYVRGEGVGVVVLKRYDDAVRDGDTIYAVIRGSAANQDGRSNGLTAPNGLAQEAVIRAALDDAGVDPHDIGYVEAHGTGTYLGDPIEAMALGAVLGKDRAAGSPCVIGSVKTNVGHLEAASGIAGLIKTALSLKRRQIPASLHFHQPNPAIAFYDLGLKVQTATTAWHDYGKAHYAGVSAFGFGGSNVHVVLEAPPNASNPAPDSERVHILPLSAHSMEALLDRARSMADWLESHGDVAMHDVCYTASARRTHMEYRGAVVSRTRVGMCEALRAFAAGSEHSAVRSGRRPSRPPKRLWRFTGEAASTEQTTALMALAAQWEELGYRPHAVLPASHELAALVRDPMSHVDLSVPAQWAEIELDVPAGSEESADFANTSFLLKVAALYARGCDPVWSVLFPKGGKAVGLPRYSWQHKSYWFDDQREEQPTRSIDTALPIRQYKQNLRVPVALLFTGQGVESSTGRELYDTEEVFRDAIDQCDKILSVHLDRSIRDLLFNPAFAPDLAQTQYAQPALCALEWSLTQLWRSWGLYPAAVMGHSLGEYVAACVAGCIDIDALLPLVSKRGRMMQALPPGGVMAAIRASVNRIAPLVERHGPSASVAAVNGPQSVVISGDRDAVYSIVREIEADGIAVRYLPVSHAFHSALIEDALPGLAEAANAVSWSAPAIPIITNLTGDFLTDAPSADHWTRHARQPVLFAQGVTKLHEMGCRAFLEVGPHTALLSMGRTSLGSEGILWLPSLERDRDPRITMSDSRTALENAGAIPPGPAANDLNRKNSMSTETISPAHDDSVSAEVLNDVRREIAKALGEAPNDINIHAPFVEMGADSLVLAQAVRTVETRYGVSIPLKRFFTDLATPSALAAFLSQRASKPDSRNGISASVQQDRPAEVVHSTADVPSIVTSPAAQDAGALERIMARQLDAMTDLMQQQLRILGQGVAPAQKDAPRIDPGKVKTADYGPFRPPRLEGGMATGLSTQQQRHVDGLIARYCGKTATSKSMAGQYRRWYADSRASAGFRISIKELLYPIVAGRTDGAHLWDIDGNRYVDISMDFGVNLLGHGASAIRDAQREQWETSIALGPRPKLAGEAAERLCRMTGMERAVFCQSGTEAVMTALRLARLATGRQRIAIFRNSYHGHSDGVLVSSIDVDGVVTQHPAAPGVPESVANDVLLLDYGTPEALELIRQHGGELAAVLVEAVQSRHPELQPREFLHEVRELTEQSGTVLIFDEMITGFRVAPGGAQEWFGVRADLATYGKILGGGVPVAAVAGRRDILDGIDGGAWEYGDSSFPGAEVTFFAGTFCCNPLAMVSAVAVLSELERQGPDLQTSLAERTARLADTLNTWFAAEDVPIRIVHFGSLFRFQFTKNLDLFFFHLLDRGVFIWEGRNCFLSTAHTEDDIEFVINAVKESVRALREGGFLPESPRGKNGSIAATAQSTAPRIHFANHATPARLPMSAAQKQLWFLSQVQPAASIAYIEPIVLEINGALDLQALQRSLDDLVARHEALRTTIDAAGEAQIIHPKFDVPIAVTDIADPPQSEPSEWLEAVLREPIDLVTGPLIRAVALRLSAVRYRFVLAIHHIVVDGWSMSVAVSELAQLYTGHIGTGGVLATKPAQFRQHILRQDTLLRSPGMEAGREFWNAMLSAPLPVLELPGDLQRPHPLGWSGARHTVRVPGDVRARAAQYSAKQGATLFMTLLGAYALWLHRITGQEDLVIGYPTHGRELPAEEGVVGYCVNILPLRLQVTERESFDEFVRRVRGLILDIDDYKDFPFAEMLRALNMSWSEGASPLIAATFNMDRAPEQFALGGLKATLLPAPIHAAKYELSLNVTDTGDHFILDFDYNRDIFSPEAVARLAAHFAFTLEEGMASGVEALRLGRVIDTCDQQTLIDLVNDSAVDLPIDVCLHRLVEQYAANWPNRIAVVAASDGDVPDDERLTYAELNDRSDRLARRLYALGVGRETAVGLCVDRSLDRIAGLIGILKAGGAYVPLSLDEPHDRRLRMLRDAGVDIVLAQRDGLDVFRDDVSHVICIDDHMDVAGIEAVDLPDTAPQNLACVLFTSGTTRHPKGVGVSHRNIANLILGLHKRYPDADTFFHHSSLQFDASTLEIWWPLLTGGRLVVAPPGLLSPDKITRLVARHDVNYLWLTTGLFQLMVEQALPGIQGIPHVMFGGEATSPRRVEEMRAAHWGGVLANAYGPTEGTTFATTFLIDPRKPIDGPLPIGKPIDNGEIYILDPYGRITPVGVAGEVYLGGEGVTRCYLRQPALTAAAFVPDPFSGKMGARLYRTGDKARVRADGNLEFLGRIDTQIKLRGFRIEPGEIETALVSLNDVEQAIAVVREDTPGDRRLVAYVTPGARRPEPSEVMDAVRELLPPYMMPGACVVLDKLPLTPNGKVDRKALPPPERNRSVNRERSLPETPTERRLYAIWSDILQVSEFGAGDDFFALGGHSLLCMRMVAAVNEEFGIAVPLRTALDHPTVSGLAAAIDAEAPEVPPQPLPGGEGPSDLGNAFENGSNSDSLSIKNPLAGGEGWGGEPAGRIRAVSREGRRVSREALTRGEAAHE